MNHKKQQQNYKNLLQLIARRREGRKSREKNSDRCGRRTKKGESVENCQRRVSKIPDQSKDRFKPVG